MYGPAVRRKKIRRAGGGIEHKVFARLTEAWLAAGLPEG